MLQYIVLQGSSDEWTNPYDERSIPLDLILQLCEAIVISQSHAELILRMPYSG